MTHWPEGTMGSSSATMFRPKDLAIEDLLRRLMARHEQAFGGRFPEHRQALVEAVRPALQRLARTDAMYHDLDHTVIVTLVGQEILMGRIVRDGDVRSQDWLQFTVALVCFSIGMVHGVCRGDAPGEAVIDSRFTRRPMPRGATAGWLWPYVVDRGQMYVRQRFRDHPTIDAEVVARILRGAQFPPPADAVADNSYEALLRAAHFIGAVADPRFPAKIKALFLELQESGISDSFPWKTLAQFRSQFPPFFWSMIHPLIRTGMDLLHYTSLGEQSLASMQAHILVAEHGIPIDHALSSRG
ncbi:hypothetical protein [Zavarzinia sp. CC-PAN008]|uniref:hypothetical protein n=1 Tax=Zavarzinia sp. CC-PAN008 TaxID=3243332 RepID=UPI003F748B71